MTVSLAKTEHHWGEPMEYDPYEHAEQLGLTVLHRPIREANGLWIPDYGTIVLRTGMGRILERCTLAHEIGHFAHGHRDETRMHQSQKHEIQADKFAANHLIDHARLLEHGRWMTEPNLALELGVTIRILRMYLNTSGLLRSA